MADPGDTVRIVGKESNVEGVLMPNNDSGTVVIKLGSGYNVGIDRKKVKRVDVLAKAKPAERKAVKAAVKKGLPAISILHTGGTIASKVDYSSGGAIAGFSPEDN